MGNFCTRKLTFSSRKLVLFVKKMPFNVQCKTFITIRNDKKIVLCFSQDFLAFGPFLGFFWPSEGLRPPSGQKNPKNGPQAKKPGCSTIFFVLPHVDIVLHFNVEIYHVLIDSLLDFILDSAITLPKFDEKNQKFQLKILAKTSIWNHKLLY